MTTSSQFGPPVSDEELMRYLDGELDEERRAEVAGQLGESEQARAKLAGLELVGELLREQVAADDRAAGIADAVMAKLEAAAAEDESAGADVVELPVKQPRPEPSPSLPQPANDNRWSIYGLAGAAAAVAAGLFLWSLTGSDEMELAGPRRGPPPSALASADGTEAMAEPRWPSPAPVAEEESDDEPSAAVEVAAVDFGSHSGSVFYVSTGPEHAATTTAVVWVTDDVTGDAP